MSNDVNADRAGREAIAWFTRLSGDPSPRDRSDFEAWLLADPAHQAAFDDIDRLCRQSDFTGRRLAAEEADVLAAYLEKMDANKRPRRPRSLAPLALLVLLVAVPAFWTWLEKPNLIADLSADHLSGIAERKLVTLPDNSTILMDADTAIAIPDPANPRRIELLRGTAFFDVRPAAEPFVVTAGDGQTTVYGTRFDVASRNETVTVNLEEGSVVVRSEKLGREEKLSPGQRVRYSASGMEAATAANISDALGWRQGRYVFEQARLGDVLQEIQRYRGGRIIVIGQELAERRISGSLPLDRPEAALQSLQASAGFQINRLGGRIIVIRP